MKTSPGTYVRELRKVKGLTIEDLADLSGISYKTIQRIENGKTNPRGFTLKKLSEALNIDIGQLTIFETNKNFEVKKNDANYNQFQEIKKLNLSALLILFLPLANIIAPYILYKKHKEFIFVKEIGIRIISFHILWLLCTSLALIAAPFSLLLFDRPVVTHFGSLIFTYIVFWLVNMMFTVWIATKLNRKDIKLLYRWPKLF